MARGDPPIVSFNGGELSPLLRGRTDVNKYASGAEFLYNFIPTAQGPMHARPGTQYVGAQKNSGSILIPFEASTDAKFVLEISNGATRVWYGPTRSPVFDTAGVWSPFSGSTPAELATPWQSGDLRNPDGSVALQFVQSNDVMWVTHPRHFPVKIRRIATYEFDFVYHGDGFNIPVPFADVDPLNTITITASATTGVITLTASAPYFTASMVNEYFYLEQPAADSVPPWEANKVVAINDIRRSDGRNYYAATAGTTGTIRPVHSSGTKYDGTTVVWAWMDEGFGVVGITAVAGDGLSCTATVAKGLPDTVATTGTLRYARSAWNVDDGYPAAVAFFRERLCFARGQTVWGSVAGDFENFAFLDGGITPPDLAFTATLAAKRNDRVLWLYGADVLLAGTAGGTYQIQEMSTADPFGPGNIKASRNSNHGVSACAPIEAGEGVLYLERGGVRLRQLAYSLESDKFNSENLSLLAEHLAPPLGFAHIAVQQQPDGVVWVVSATGMLFGFTYDRRQEVGAWHRHQLAGLGYGGSTSLLPQVGSICCIESPDSRFDDVWMTTTRNIGGTPSFFIEVLGPSEKLDITGSWQYHELDDVREANYLDCSVKSQVAAGDTDLPAAHLIGAPAMALLEGMVTPAGTVTASGLPVAADATTARSGRVGFPVQSDYKSMDLVGVTNTGGPNGKTKRILGLVLRCYRSQGFQYGTSDGDLDLEEFRSQDFTMDESFGLFSGDKPVPMPSAHESNLHVYIRKDQPLPLTIIGLYPRLKTAD